MFPNLSRQLRLFGVCVLLSGLTLGLRPLSARADAPATMTEDDVIAGTMDIAFHTRTQLDTSGKLKAGSAALGAEDKYVVNMKVAKTTEFVGDISRRPTLYSKTLQRSQQTAQLGFNLGVSIVNPKDPSQKKDVGKWTGIVPIDVTTGAYDLAGGKKDEHGLRFAIETVGAAKGFSDFFEGRLIGKAESKTKLAPYTYKRIVGKKTVEVTVKKPDPIKFDNVVLAKGPAEVYPRATAAGRLDYDYDTGNWLTDGIHFKYNLDGTDYEDVVTGSIKWVEDADRKTSGKGHYEFNLRFNDDKNHAASTEGAAFEKMSGEEAFFAVDNSIPTLTGTVEYVDTLIAGGTTPSASKATYHLKANKLTKQQVMNFYKLWMLCVGPANDE